MTTAPIAAGPNDVTVSLEQMLADMESVEFEKFVTAPPFEYSAERMTELSAWPGNYRSLAVQLAWEAWQARAAFRQPCRGVRHPNCDYLAPCGSICNKCGQKT